jgi:hypothetical protein
MHIEAGEPEDQFDLFGVPANAASAEPAEARKPPKPCGVLPAPL